MPHLPQGVRANYALKDFFSFGDGKANHKSVDVVLYLASDEAKYGSTFNLVVDGGFTSMNHNLRAFEDWLEVVSHVMPVHDVVVLHRRGMYVHARMEGVVHQVAPPPRGDLTSLSGIA
jgi:hypothetical protein